MLFIFSGSILASCSNKNENQKNVISDVNLEQIIKSNKRTIIFIWTSWCGVSGGILKDTYIANADSFKNNNMNVLMLCASSGQDSMLNLLNNVVGMPAYYLEGNSTQFSFLNRSAIEKTIGTIFMGKTGDLFDGNFGIPITLIVNDSLDILQANAPQEFAGLKYLYEN